MEFDTEKIKQKVSEQTEKLTQTAQENIDNFKKKQWPQIKNKLDETSEKAVDFGKKHGGKVWTKSKQSFKDGVRKLDQWVNGSSVHRDDK